MTNRWLGVGANVAALALLAWVAYSIYERGFWRQQTLVIDDQPVKTAKANRNKNVDIKQIVNAHLFGVAQKAKPVQQVVEAPKTRLKLTLIGSVQSDSGAMSRAIIQTKGKQQSVVGIGEEIGKTGAKLHSVEKDRVLIERNGALESLEMERVNLAALTQDLNRSLSGSRSSGTASEIPLPEPTQPVELELVKQSLEEAVKNDAASGEDGADERDGDADEGVLPETANGNLAQPTDQSRKLLKQPKFKNPF